MKVLKITELVIVILMTALGLYLNHLKLEETLFFTAVAFAGFGCLQIYLLLTQSNKDLTKYHYKIFFIMIVAFAISVLVKNSVWLIGSAVGLITNYFFIWTLPGLARWIVKRKLMTYCNRFDKLETVDKVTLLDNKEKFFSEQERKMEVEIPETAPPFFREIKLSIPDFIFSVLKNDGRAWENIQKYAPWETHYLVQNFLSRMFEYIRERDKLMEIQEILYPNRDFSIQAKTHNEMQLRIELENEIKIFEKRWDMRFEH